MPRRRLAGCGGFVFHVMNRSAKQLTLFDEPVEYEMFLQVLDEAEPACPISTRSIDCVMPNHWHLLRLCRRARRPANPLHALDHRGPCATLATGAWAAREGRRLSGPLSLGGGAGRTALRRGPSLHPAESRSARTWSTAQATGPGRARATCLGRWPGRLLRTVPCHSTWRRDRTLRGAASTTEVAQTDAQPASRVAHALRRPAMEPRA